MLKKTVCLYFESRKFKLHAVPCLRLDEMVLTYRESHKILGIEIDGSGCDDKDISRQVRGLYFRANMLCRKFSSCSYNVKRQLFVSYCTNMYCANLWSRFSLGQIQKLKVAYNKSFRKLFKLPARCSASEMFVHRNVPTFDILMRRNVYSLQQRLMKSENALVQAATNSHFRYHSKLQARWDTVLYK